MNSRFTIVETSLNRAEFRWKWLRFVQHTFALGTVLSLLVLLAGVGMLCGWVTDKFLVGAFFVLLAIGAFLVWIIIIISVAAGAPDRSWLAAAVERVQPRLLD